jgi:Protein of unknown function (DUF3224)
MTKVSRTRAVQVFIACLSLRFSHAQNPAPFSPPQQERAVTTHASGKFEVKLTPETLADKAADKTLARMSIDKQFHGDLEASSKGEMLSALTAVKGSAGYVAIERVTGTLKGRKGSFVLQHSATMNRGTPHLHIVVVPDSGTDELTGLAGKMTIDIAPGGQHSYDFEYAFAVR